MGRGDDAAVADTQLMQLVSRSVFGTGAQAADRMGDALKINRRSVQRWLNGQNPVPAFVLRELLELVASRQRELAVIRETLERRIADRG